MGASLAIIDIGVLYLLHESPGFSVYTARIVSYSSALTVGYFLNRNFTFHHVENSRHVFDELVRFFSVHAVGGVLNFGVFALVMYASSHAELAGFWKATMPLVGVCSGGVVGMCFNFFFSRELVFTD